MFFQLNDNTLINLNYVISVTKRNYSTGENRFGMEFLVDTGSNPQKYESYFKDEDSRDSLYDFLVLRF